MNNHNDLPENNNGLLDNDELLHIWHTLQGYCSGRRRDGTGKKCVLYGVCTNRDCEPENHPLSRKIRRAMLTGAPVEYAGIKFDYVCGYSMRCDKRHGKLNEPYMMVELMDEGANSIVRVPPEMVRFPDNGFGIGAEVCVSCGEIIPEGRQTCPACEARAGLT